MSYLMHGLSKNIAEICIKIGNWSSRYPW